MADMVHDQIQKLEAARQLVLGDSSHYSAIVPGILPIIGAQSHIEIRRWGADFLAEAFASPELATRVKESLSIAVLQTLKELLEIPGEDANVVKSVIQTAASIYGLIFRYIIYNQHDSATWERMAGIKSNVLKRWDAASIGVRICCIKFVQRVVQVQTPGVIADPRRPEQNEISLALVPRDHPLIPPPILEAEASGLLDRLLNVFHEEPSDAVLVNATLNCLGVLVRSRQSVASKIVTAVLAFNPLKQANSPMSSKVKVQIKSMERTTRMFLLNTYRRNENGPFAARIKQHLERLAQSRMDIFDETSRKRGAPVESADGLDSAKRMRLGANMEGRASVPPLPPGPVSYAQLYTLTTEEGLRSFDVTQLPIDLVVRITLPVLQRIDQGLLEEAITGVRERLVTLRKTQPVIPPDPILLPTAPAFVEDEDDDYEPVEDTEQILNKMDVLPSEDMEQPTVNLALGPFKLPQPPPLTHEEAEQHGKITISRIISMLSVLDEPSRASKLGLNRLAGSNYGREAWITVITRLATRASSGLQGEDEVKQEAEQIGTLMRHKGHNLSDGIRETLWKYVIDDFRVRIPIAISWLNEEWYNDRMLEMQLASEPTVKWESPPAQRNYETWVLRVLDGIVPYLDAKDKVLIRFLSEVPAIDETILERVKHLADDPDRVSLAVNAIHYLILLRPPVREMCINALVDLWKTVDEAKKMTQKLLAKWRPQVLEDAASNDSTSAKLLPLVPVSSEEMSAPIKTPLSPSAVAAVG